MVDFLQLSPISRMHLWSSATVIFVFFFTSINVFLCPKAGGGEPLRRCSLQSDEGGSNEGRSSREPDGPALARYSSDTTFMNHNIHLMEVTKT